MGLNSHLEGILETVSLTQKDEGSDFQHPHKNPGGNHACWNLSTVELKSGGELELTD